MSPFVTLLTAIKKLLSFKVDRNEFREAVRETKKDIEDVKKDIEDTKREIEDIVEEVEEVEGNIVQSDWNQNDESAPDHVKNRPFYEDVSLRTVVCKEQTITLQDGKYSYFEYDTWTEDGVEYIVVFDGVEYPVVCWSDSDACFRLDFPHTSGRFVTIMDSAIVANGLAGEHTLAIYTNDGIKRIDTKFIPKSVLDDLESLNVSINQKMDVRDPVGTGPLSMNRLSNTTVGVCSTTLGGENRAETNYSHAEGYKTSVTADNSVIPNGDIAYIDRPYQKGKYGHAEGYGTVVSGVAGHTEGIGTKAEGIASHAEGRKTTAEGNYSHAEGCEETTASGYCSHAEGYSTTASGSYSHAEGKDTTASGAASHAEGGKTTASGDYSHAEGSLTTASGHYAHAEGVYTTASGYYSHAEGRYTIAASAYQHTQGKYNIEDADKKYAHIVGNGTSESARSNAHTLDWDGNAWYSGTLKLGGTSYDDAKEVALKEDIPTVATENKLGTVKVSAKTEDMTQPVGIGVDGFLFTAPGNARGFELIADVTASEDLTLFEITEDISGNPFSLKECMVMVDLYPALLEGSSPGLSISLRVGDQGEGYNPYFYGQAQLGGLSNEGEHRWSKTLFYVAEDGFVIPYDHAIAYNATSMPHALGYTNGLWGFHRPVMKTDAKTFDTLNYVANGISRVAIGSYDTAVGANTRIVIYGVRE